MLYMTGSNKYDDCFQEIKGLRAEPRQPCTISNCQAGLLHINNTIRGALLISFTIIVSFSTRAGFIFPPQQRMHKKQAESHLLFSSFAPLLFLFKWKPYFQNYYYYTASKTLSFFALVLYIYTTTVCLGNKVANKKTMEHLVLLFYSQGHNSYIL